MNRKKCKFQSFKPIENEKLYISSMLLRLLEFNVTLQFFKSGKNISKITNISDINKFFTWKCLFYFNCRNGHFPNRDPTRFSEKCNYHWKITISNIVCVSMSSMRGNFVSISFVPAKRKNYDFPLITFGRHLAIAKGKVLSRHFFRQPWSLSHNQPFNFHFHLKKANENRNPSQRPRATWLWPFLRES